MIHTDQTPQFSTHVIRWLTVKFNHHRVKVYYLHMFCLANLPIQTIVNHSSKREYARCFFTAATPPRSRSEQTQREREAGHRSIPLWTETYTQSYVKIPIILLNTVGYVLCEPKQLRRNWMCVSIRYAHLVLKRQRPVKCTIVLFYY